MSTSPVLHIFKSAPSVTSSRINKTLSKEQFSFELNKVFVDFRAKVEKIKLKSAELKVKQFSPNIEQYKDGLTTDFARISVLKKDKLIEDIVIYADKHKNRLKFTILPSWTAFSYNINKDPHARARTEALEVIARSLFEASNSDVAITTSDEDMKSYGLVAKPEKLIPDSMFTFFKSKVFPQLKKDLENGDLPVNFTKDFGDFVGVSVTDQPFSLSSYNSDGTSPGLTYYRSVLDIINRIKKKK